MVKLDKNFRNMKNEIYSHMLKTRGKKFKWFLKALRSFKYLSMSPTRGNFLESYYILMRYVDDVVDEDAELPQGYSSPAEFVEEKINFAKRPVNPKDSVDYLILYCFELADKFGQDFSEETKDILSSMYFDARRIGKSIMFPKKELDHHFYLLDIRGTIKAALKAFGENANKYPALESMGVASRIYFNLRDYDDDIKTGLVNIPVEDCNAYNINTNDLENKISEGVQKWFHTQATQGMESIARYKESFSGQQFGWLTRITLPVVFEMPATAFFEKILTDNTY